MKSVRCASNRRVRATLAAIGLCFAVVSTTPVAAPAAPVAGACETTGTKAKVSTTRQSTSSTTFVNVIETAIFFTQSRTGCVIISFSAEAGGNTNTLMFVSAVIDGFGCAPYNVAFVSPQIDPTVRTVNFLCPNIGTGNHQAKMLFRSGGPGGVWFYARTMIVHYSK